MDRSGWRIGIFEWISRTSGHIERAAGIRSWKRGRDALESAWYDYVSANLPDVLKTIAESGKLEDAEKAKLDEAVKGFKQTVTL